MFVKLKYLLHKSDYNVTDEEVEKAFQNLGYAPITNSQKKCHQNKQLEKITPKLSSSKNTSKMEQRNDFI